MKTFEQIKEEGFNDFKEILVGGKNEIIDSELKKRLDILFFEKSLNFYLEIYLEYTKILNSFLKEKGLENYVCINSSETLKGVFFKECLNFSDFFQYIHRSYVLSKMSMSLDKININEDVRVKEKDGIVETIKDIKIQEKENEKERDRILKLVALGKADDISEIFDKFLKTFIIETSK